MEVFKVDQCANHLTNEFMSGFNNRVGSRSVRRDVDSFDAGIIKRELKVVTFEFWTVVMNDFGWTSILRDNQWFSKRRQELSVFLGPWSRMISIRLVTGLMHVSVRQSAFSVC